MQRATTPDGANAGVAIEDITMATAKKSAPVASQIKDTKKTAKPAAAPEAAKAKKAAPKKK